MSEKDNRRDGPDDATERELIEMEFQSKQIAFSFSLTIPFLQPNRFQSLLILGMEYLHLKLLVQLRASTLN